MNAIFDASILNRRNREFLPEHTNPTFIKFLTLSNHINTHTPFTARHFNRLNKFFDGLFVAEGMVPDFHEVLNREYDVLISDVQFLMKTKSS